MTISPADPNLPVNRPNPRPMNSKKFAERYGGEVDVTIRALLRRAVIEESSEIPIPCNCLGLERQRVVAPLLTYWRGRDISKSFHRATAHLPNDALNAAHLSEGFDVSFCHHVGAHVLCLCKRRK